MSLGTIELASLSSRKPVMILGVELLSCMVILDEVATKSDLVSELTEQVL